MEGRKVTERKRHTGAEMVGKKKVPNEKLRDMKKVVKIKIFPRVWKLPLSFPIPLILCPIFPFFVVIIIWHPTSLRGY